MKFNGIWYGIVWIIEKLGTRVLTNYPLVIYVYLYTPLVIYVYPYRIRN